MSWMFLPGGLLMPASVPMDLADEKYTEGRRDLQIRARVASHLTNFIRDYMEPLGLDYSEIEATPQMDYNFRFYTTREEFAVAIAQTIRDIDYEKFKPTAEREVEDGPASWRPWRIYDANKKVSRDPLPEEIEIGNTKTGRWVRPLLYEDGEAYHTTLNAIWSSVTRLGSPGGSWGAYTRSNPNGYRSASEYAKKYGTVEGYGYLDDFDDDEPTWKTGDSFRKSGSSGRARDVEWWESDDATGDHTPQREQDVQDIISTMDGIPTDQWIDFLSEWEYKMVEPYITDVDNERTHSQRSASKEQRRASAREQRRVNRRQARKQRNRERRAAQREDTSHGEKAVTFDPAEAAAEFADPERKY